MSTSRPFAYNPSQTNIPGVELFGYLSVGPIGSGKITGLTTWNGPNEDLGYVIAKVVYDNSQPTPIGFSASVAFYRSSTFTEAAFLHIVNRGLHLNYSEGSVANNYLLSNGYWTNYPTLDPDAVIYMSALNSPPFGDPVPYYDTYIINQLFLGLKSTGLYDKMEAFYPMIGNAAWSQRLNAKSVGGVRQSVYDLYFVGGWSFTSGPGGYNTARGNNFNTFIGVDKKYYDLSSLINTHFSVYSFPGTNLITAAADVFVFDPNTTNGLSYRFVEMRLSDSPINNQSGYFVNQNQRSYSTTFDYPGNIPDYAGPIPTNSGLSSNSSFAIMSYDNNLLDGTNNFSINGTLYSNYGTSPSDPATTPYGADLYFGYYYDWYHGMEMYTGAEYGWLGFGTNLDVTEQYNYQSIVNAFMQSNGKSNY